MRTIFVYGTMRRGWLRHDALGNNPRLVGVGTVPGVLLDLGAFPGLVEGEGRVFGEVYSIADARIPLLDRIEGVHAGMYERREVLVALAVGGHRTAEAYFFCEEPRFYSQGVIASGDWVEYKTGRAAEDALPEPDEDFPREEPDDDPF